MLFVCTRCIYTVFKYRFGVRAGLAGGFIYWTREEGLWGDAKASTELYQRSYTKVNNLLSDSPIQVLSLISVYYLNIITLFTTIILNSRCLFRSQTANPVWKGSCHLSLKHFNMLKKHTCSCYTIIFYSMQKILCMSITLYLYYNMYWMLCMFQSVPNKFNYNFKYVASRLVYPSDPILTLLTDLYDFYTPAKPNNAQLSWICSWSTFCLMHIIYIRNGELCEHTWFTSKVGYMLYQSLPVDCERKPAFVSLLRIPIFLTCPIILYYPSIFIFTL